MHRFTEIEILDGKKIKTLNFDLDGYLHKNNLGFEYSDKLYTFKAILIKPWVHILKKLLNTQQLKELDDGRLLISARVPDTLQFEQWLMSFGAEVEILEPAN